MVDPFAEGLTRHFKTGVVIDEDVVKGLLSSSATGEALYKGFVDQKLIETVKNREGIFQAS